MTRFGIDSTAGLQLLIDGLAVASKRKVVTSTTMLVTNEQTRHNFSAAGLTRHGGGGVYFLQMGHASFVRNQVAMQRS